jgi:hypothetical protein
MSKKLIWIIVGVVVLGTGAFIAFRFFKGSNKHLILVPANATFVIRFDVKSIAEKIYANGDIKQTKVYKQLEKKSSDSDAESKIIAQILKDPSSIGINMFSDVYYYMYNTKNVNYNAFVLDIKDLDDFNRTIAKFPHSKDKIVKGKEFNYLKMNSRSIMAWNNTGLLILNKEYSWFYDESPNEKIEKTVKGFMTMSKESSILSDKDFMSYNDNEDIDDGGGSSYLEVDETLQYDPNTNIDPSSNATSISLMSEFGVSVRRNKNNLYDEMLPYIEHNYKEVLTKRTRGLLDTFFKEMIELNNL